MTPNHIDIFPWNDSFNTGVHEIDQQHQKLVVLINQFASFATLQRSDVELDTLISEVLDYAVYHFDTEDSYWLNTLPESHDVKQHEDCHNRFIQQAHEFKGNINTLGEDQWLEELLSFLVSWLASHILKSDKYMVLLVEAVQSGKPLDEATAWAEEQMRETEKETVNIILAAYKNLSENAIRLMRAIKIGNHTLNKLTKSERRLQEAMDYAQVGRWSFPYKGRVADWSPQMFSLLGLEQDTVPGPESLCSIMHEEFQQPFLTSMHSSFETGQEHRIEYQITRPNDGELRWIECRGKVKYQEDGTPDRISGFIQDITERKENENEIIKHAYHDSLTSLPNRRLFFDRLNQSLALSDRSDQYSAILYLDIDDFKKVNDGYGHEYGDMLLQQAAKRIQQCIREGDTLARIGGDEFALILTGLNENEAEAASKAELVAHKILRVLSLPYQINNQTFNSSVSAGIALFNDSSIMSSELIKHADIAMFQVKKSRKNAVCFYEPLMKKEISERIKLEKDLHDALEKQQFELYYQPQVDAHGEVIGAEALIRWQHPVDGLIFPNSFIRVAEETGLIIPIGSWVMQMACQQLSRWRANKYTKDLTLSVNVSYQQFCQPDFVSLVSDLVRKYRLEEGKLKIELTESMLVDDVKLTISYMEALKKQGVHFSLDDFGTGYSSLQYLKRLPLSQLKIDRSFVFELESSVNDQSIVKTIILMANALDINVIAEGVEVIAQRNYLNELGCLSYQGYLFSKPVPINEFEAYSKRLKEETC